MPEVLEPTSVDRFAAALAGAAANARPVRVLGSGTKAGWGALGPAPTDALELRTGALHRTVEHNVGDLTAVFEAGVPFERAQAELAAEGQMLAVDPPLGRGEESAATIGGVFATGDSGPLRHRYGAPRDLILGITVALSDGTVAKAGGKVIKNVAGYDLAKLFTGSFGTLGAILSVSVRLHPLPFATATAVGAANDPDVIATAAVALSRAPLELEALDVAWRRGRGGLLAQVGGAEAERRAADVAARMRALGLTGVDVVADDGALWARQRAGQRSEPACVVRVAAARTDLPAVLRLADASGATVVGRAALGLSWIELAADELATLRAGLPDGSHAVVLDGAVAGGDVAGPDAVWGAPDAALLALMQRVKQRFDPAGVCNPGVFVGGI